jgi:hypothetical protein
VDALQRLLDGRGFTSQVALDALLHYPALLALRTMSIVTIDEGRDDFLIELLTHPRWTDPYGRRGPANAAEVLHINRALDGSLARTHPQRTEQNGRNSQHDANQSDSQYNNHQIIQSLR